MHRTTKLWIDNGMDSARPCDWCGHAPIEESRNIHVQPCPDCKRKCYAEESRFYTQLGYDGESDVKVPEGYQIVIPR